MSFFISLGITVLAMVVIMFLQLRPGVFMLFSHYTRGKFSRARASDLSIFFILGAEAASACIFLCSYYLTNLFFLYSFRPETSFFAWVAVGVLIALAIASIFCYFRPGPGTRLFISRASARALDTHARGAKSRSDAFILGAMSGMCELVFALPLYIIASVELIELSVSPTPTYLLMLLFIIAPILPLFVIRWRFASRHNLAELQRSRVRSKSFIRILLPICYLTIAILIIYFRITAS